MFSPIGYRRFNLLTAYQRKYAIIVRVFYNDILRRVCISCLNLLIKRRFEHVCLGGSLICNTKFLDTIDSAFEFMLNNRRSKLVSLKLSFVSNCAIKIYVAEIILANYGFSRSISLGVKQEEFIIKCAIT